jgi:hypothetical protein
MSSSSDITRARRLQVTNNDLIGGPKPHNLTAVNTLNCIIQYSGPPPSKTLPKNLKCLLRARDGGVLKPNNTPVSNPKCCGRI